MGMVCALFTCKDVAGPCAVSSLGLECRWAERAHWLHGREVKRAWPGDYDDAETGRDFVTSAQKNGVEEWVVRKYCYDRTQYKIPELRM